MIDFKKNKHAKAFSMRNPHYKALILTALFSMPASAMTVKMPDMPVIQREILQQIEDAAQNSATLQTLKTAIGKAVKLTKALNLGEQKTAANVLVRKNEQKRRLQNSRIKAMLASSPFAASHVSSSALLQEAKHTERYAQLALNEVLTPPPDPVSADERTKLKKDFAANIEAILDETQVHGDVLSSLMGSKPEDADIALKSPFTKHFINLMAPAYLPQKETGLNEKRELMRSKLRSQVARELFINTIARRVSGNGLSTDAVRLTTVTKLTSPRYMNALSNSKKILKPGILRENTHIAAVKLDLKLEKLKRQLIREYALANRLADAIN